MAGFSSSLISVVVTDVITRVAGILTTNRVIKKIKRRVARIFPVLDKNDEDSILYHLNVGNELCRGRRIPMSAELITKVKIIYRKCQLELQDEYEETPVMYAAFKGYADMVWGFIQCSKETTTNLHTQRRSREPLDFLWLRNSYGMTALEAAIDSDHVEVAKILLSNASRKNLASAWDSKGKVLLPLLHDYPKHDGFIFDMLEKETRKAELVLPISTPIPVEEESIVNAESRKYLEKLSLLGSNPNKNNILHIVCKFGYVNYVKEILEKHPSLISRQNSEGETPVYVAAREGHVDVLQIMFNHLKENNEDIKSLAIRPKDEHNALHIAIQNHHAPVIFLLLQKIPQLANLEKFSKESPLYLASERSYFEIVKLILKKCTDKTNVTGPNGKTALHAAAISNSAECVKYLLDKRPHLLNEKDEYGWTALRYAVHYNSSLAMEELLNVDQLVTQDDTVTSALHFAARRGHCETIKVLMSKCLGCSEFIDSNGRNILHVAIESKQTEVIEFIFNDELLTSLINQKDKNGNTPAHLLVASDFEMMQNVIDSRVDIHSLNNENLTPLDMIASDEERKRLIKAMAMGTNMCDKINSSSPNIIMNDLYEKELEARQKKSEAYFKMVDNLVLVVTLIATATFAAAFTVPGGFDSDSGSKQGTPYLLKKAAFQAFVITNAIAFSCSCSVLLAHILLLIYRNRYDEAGETERKYIDGRIVIMYFLTGFALLAMLIAFVTGFYVVLLPSLWLAIFVCAFSICIVVVSLFR